MYEVCSTKTTNHNVITWLHLFSNLVIWSSHFTWAGIRISVCVFTSGPVMFLVQLYFALKVRLYSVHTYCITFEALNLEYDSLISSTRLLPFINKQLLEGLIKCIDASWHMRAVADARGFSLQIMSCRVHHFVLNQLSPLTIKIIKNFVRVDGRHSLAMQHHKKAQFIVRLPLCHGCFVVKSFVWVAF